MNRYAPSPATLAISGEKRAYWAHFVLVYLLEVALILHFARIGGDPLWIVIWERWIAVLLPGT